MEKNKLISKIIPFLVVILFVFGTSLLEGESTLADKIVKVSFLDVGQGDGILITDTENKHYLIDGGPDKSILNKLGDILPPTEKTIDTVILTHPHADHLAGLNYVLDSYKVNQVYLTGAVHTSNDYLEFLQLVEKKEIKSHKLIAPLEIKTGEMTLRALWPNQDIIYQDLNQTSLVLLMTYQENEVLFMGDLPEKEQEQITEHINRPVDIIKVSHHGSKTGLSEKLLLKSNPKYAVISVGKNSFGHPSLITLKKLINQIVLRTDQKGTINFILTGKDYYLK